MNNMSVGNLVCHKNFTLVMELLHHQRFGMIDVYFSAISHIQVADG